MAKKMKQSRAFIASRSSFPVPAPETVAISGGAAGAWTAATLAEWGIPWPPPHGWRRTLGDLHAAGASTWPGWSSHRVAKPDMARPEFEPNGRQILYCATCDSTDIRRTITAPDPSSVSGIRTHAFCSDPCLAQSRFAAFGPARAHAA